MPHFHLFTNLLRSEVPAEFVNKAGTVVGNLLGKPEAKCIVTLVPGQLISFGGDSVAPGATATLMSIGKLGLEENKTITKGLSELLDKELGIPSHRFLITFNDALSFNVGILGTTAQALGE